MKSRFTTLLITTFLTTSALFSITYLSCTRDKCKSVICAHGGTCNGGTCTCPTGYQGAVCDTLSRNKFLGNWNIDERGSVTNESHYSVNIAPGVNNNEVAINNFYNYFTEYVYAYVHLDTIFLYSQQYQGKLIYGGYGVMLQNTTFGANNYISMKYEIVDSAITSGGAIPGAKTVSSGDIERPISYAASFPAGITTSVNVTSVPVGSSVTGISVTFNATEALDGDFELNLMAPNGQVINLFSSGSGNTGSNFLNTTISSAGVNVIPNGPGGPWTGTWAASANAVAGSSVYPQTTGSWTALENANPNGTWVLIGRNTDPSSPNNLTILKNWSITINYNFNVPVVNDFGVYPTDGSKPSQWSR